MAHAKNLVNNLSKQIKNCEDRWKFEIEQDWQNGEMSCIAAMIFGMSVFEYMNILKHELISEVNHLVYIFQNDIYTRWQKGRLSYKEYNYCYCKSKEMLL